VVTLTTRPGVAALEQFLRELSGSAGIGSAFDDKLAADLHFQAETLRHVADELDIRAARLEAEAARHAADEKNLSRLARGLQQRRGPEPGPARRKRIEESHPETVASLVADARAERTLSDRRLAERYRLSPTTVARIHAEHGVSKKVSKKSRSGRSA
jgi:ribosome-binding protein aMBF1 (putative translation factor)